MRYPCVTGLKVTSQAANGPLSVSGAWGGLVPSMAYVNSLSDSQAWPPTMRHDQDGEGRASGSGGSGAVNGETGRVPRLVVGISRSWASWWALAWAVGEARRRRARLLLAHVFRPPVAPATAAYGEAASACPGTRTPTAGITPEGSRMSANGGQRRGFGPYRAS